jgi:hypothetical protein
MSLSPSFSLELFSFRATAPAKGRGEVTARWHGSKGTEERRNERWVHPFDEARLRALLKALEGLPERCGPFMDDAAERRIAIEDAGVEVARVRACTRLRPDAATRAFDELWRELYEPVTRCLAVLGVPRELL